jgi:hypothetical protein
LPTESYLDAKEIRTVARRFPRAIFTVGADAASWNSNKAFDLYVTAVVVGIAETGRNVASGVRLPKSSDGHRYFEGNWHYKHNEVVIEAFVSNIQNDIRYGCMSQSGARVFKTQIYKGEMGIMALGAVDSNGRRIYSHDAYGLGNSGVTSVSPDRSSAHHDGVYTPNYTFGTWSPNLSGEEDPEQPIEIPWCRTPHICDCSKFPFRAEKFEAWKPDPDWLVRKRILGRRGGAVIFGENRFTRFKIRGSNRPNCKVAWAKRYCKQLRVTHYHGEPHVQRAYRW